MIRLGMLDFDTSHAIEFTRRLNHHGIPPDQWVHGAQVVLGCPGDSRMSPERIPGYTKEMEEAGVSLVPRPTDMIGKVDGMMIESLEGAAHLERARPFLEAGIPCFVDKPFACSRADALAIQDLAARSKVPVFSSSALRFAPELVAFTNDPQKGKVLGVVSHGTAPYYENKSAVPRNPGLFHYGIHALEVLYTLMGPGCDRVRCHHQEDVDLVVGHWKDGRVATLRGLRAGKTEWGFLAFTTEVIEHVRLSTTYVYRNLLEQMVRFFQTRESPVDLEVTIEMVAFMEAALVSAADAGALVELAR